MYQFSVIFTLLNIIFLSVLAAPLPLDQSVDKRQIPYSGRGTWYYVDANESACNTWNQNNQPIIALSVQIFNVALCGQWISITTNGITQSGMVGDACEGCSPGDLDMSPTLFGGFANPNVGVLDPVTWQLPSS